MQAYMNKSTQLYKLHSECLLFVFHPLPLSPLDWCLVALTEKGITAA